MRDLTKKEFAVVAGGFLTNTGGKAGTPGAAGGFISLGVPGAGGAKPGGSGTANFFISPNAFASNGRGTAVDGSAFIII